jgi:arylsulfatase A-like enzyme
VIIVTADHGEEFFEHGKKGHKNNLYAESVHVPLIVKYPQGSPTGRDARLVSQVDLFPSILEIAESEATPLHQGHSLLAKAPEDRAVFYELTSLWYFQIPEKHTRTEEWRGVRRGPYKLVWTDEALPELFDVIGDPGEQVNLAAERPGETDELLRGYRDWAEESAAIAKSIDSGGEAELTEEELERLRSLGYVGP